MPFVHLHSHSQYSILEASASVYALAEKAAKHNMPAIALTDNGNLFGAVDFYKACTSKKVKPIIGCELYLAPESRHDRKKVGGRASFSQVFLAKDKEGYHNLSKLSSIGYAEGFYYTPRIDHEMLEKHTKGLICLSGSLSGRLAQALLSKENVDSLIAWYIKLFGEDFYLELQRHTMLEENIHAEEMTQESWLIKQYEDLIAKQTFVNEAFLELSKKYGIPCIVTNDTHYTERGDWKAHEILLNIQSGEPCEMWEKDSFGNLKFRVPNPKRRTFASHEYYFKTPEEMLAIFPEYPEYLQNTLDVAAKCNLELDFKTKHYPVFVPPALEGLSYTDKERAAKAEAFLKQLCLEGIEKRYTPAVLACVQKKYSEKDPLQVVRDRLELELSVIIPKGMCDYLLIVWDFIHWAKCQGIPMGPGRGSGAGSIVLFLIGITDIEPLRFNLFFERFINPERISYPDIDVDICMDRRGEVIHYTMKKYGKQNIAHIITFGTMKAKMTIKDVGRVLSIPLPKVNEIAKRVPEDLNITLNQALEKDPDFRSLYEEDEEARRIIDLGKTLEGSIRNTGIHAAGIIISGEPLTEHIPVCNSKDVEIPVTQYSMKPVEMVGMLKIDFLGLKTLTCIQMCVDAIRRDLKVSIDWVNLPLDDQATFALLNQGRTLGVFQLESQGMQELARNLHLDCFEEIIAVGSLYRPGPMDMIPSFCNRKHGREPIEYDHPSIKEILKETYGIMVYQEQVMQIASELAGYSLGEGDVLRRAMGKKDMAEMVKQREKFRTGAMKGGVEEEVAMRIFDRMEKFAAYGFNKSHAAAYAYLSYVTAYLKANYPKEWMAALMTCDRDDTAKVAKFIQEARAMNIPVLPPDINESREVFVATNQGIRLAMAGIKGVGEGVVQLIVEQREKKGPFQSLYKFIKRMDTRKVGKKAIEILVQAGCFDFTGWSRDALRESIEPIYEEVAKQQKNEHAGIRTFFALLGDEGEKRFETPPVVQLPTSRQEMILKEKELLGFFLSGHPLDSYRELQGKLSCIPLSKIEGMTGDTVFRASFLVEEVKVKLTRTQKKFAFLTISDGLLKFEVTVWSDVYEDKKDLVAENKLVYAVLQFEKKPEGERISCKWLGDLNQVDEKMVEECDKAFDKTKFQVGRAPYPKKEKPKVSEKESAPLVVEMDVNRVSLSHILDFKAILQGSSGSIPVKVQFVAGSRKVALLHLDPSVGVSDKSSFAQKIRSIPSVV